jgi:hypothetical protein
VGILNSKKMKKLILLLAIAGFITQTQAQILNVKKVPETVTAAFNKTYPSVKDVDWSKDGNNYEAKYEADKIGKSVTYDTSGKLIETEVEIETSDLPAPIMEYVKNNYKADKVKEASKITDANGIVTYEAEVKGVDLIFDSKCNFIK